MFGRHSEEEDIEMMAKASVRKRLKQDTDALDDLFDDEPKQRKEPRDNIDLDSIPIAEFTSGMRPLNKPKIMMDANSDIDPEIEAPIGGLLPNGVPPPPPPVDDGMDGPPEYNPDYEDE